MTKEQKQLIEDLCMKTMEQNDSEKITAATAKFMDEYGKELTHGEMLDFAAITLASVLHDLPDLVKEIAIKRFFMILTSLTPELCAQIHIKNQQTRKHTKR
jgi:hypothetical protein